ncbi:MAG: phosphoribosylformylglycinamidine synthase subunit PurS [Actinomycetota bacterium]
MVEVKPREGIADPEGATVQRALAGLGYEGVGDVRIGKAVRFTIEAASEAEARAQVDELCQRLLTNPVIEDADIAVEALDEAARA